MTGVTWLIQNAVLATMMAGVLALVVRWARPKPALEHALWLLVAAKFVLPPLAVVALPLALPDVLGAVGSLASFSAPAETGAVADGPAAPVTVRTGDPATAPVAPMASDDVVPGVAPAAPGSETGAWSALSALPFSAGSAVRWLIALWLTLALVGGAWRLTRHGLWLRRLERASVGPTAELAGLIGLVAEGAALLGVRAPRLVVSRGVTSPLVTGLRAPVLYWPVELMGVLAPERVRTIVAHELAHLRRRDLWSGALELLVDCLWRWYPGWRVVRRRLRDAAERACDLVVVETYPSCKRQYAEAILDVLSLDARRRRGALALGIDGPGPLEQRIERILHPPASGRRRTLGYAAIGVVALALTPAWVPVQPPGVAADEPVETAVGAQANDGAAELGAVLSRGVVRWPDGRTAAPQVSAGGWLIAFGIDGASSRRLEIRADARGSSTMRWVVDGRDTRFDDAAAVWLRALFERTHYDVDATRPSRSSSAAWVPDGPHVHRTDGNESLAFWSTSEGGIRTDGTLDADPRRPLYLVHQRVEGGPVEFLVLAGEAGAVRVLERSVDAHPAPIDARAIADARRSVERAAEWILRPTAR